MKNQSGSRSDKVFDAVLLVVLTLILLITLYPVYFVLISSFSDPVAVAGGDVTFWPVGFTLEGYQTVLKDSAIVRGFLNSVVYTVVGVLVNLFLTLPTAYALSRRDFPARKPILVFYMITMFVSGGMMPTYLVVQQTGLLDTMWALILPGAVNVYNLLTARAFFRAGIPEELLEAARIDGCNNTRFFLQVALPLSGALVAIMVLYYGVAHWNSYFNALLYISDQNKWPLQMQLRSVLLQNSWNAAATGFTPEQLAERQRLEALAEMMKYSLIVLSCLPMMIAYPFVQKHLVKGVMLGAIKG